MTSCSERAPADRVWEHASSFAGVNRELWPLSMTHPADRARLTPESVPLGRPAFRSWILLFGLIPVDYDDITLVELEPGQFYLFRNADWLIADCASCGVNCATSGVNCVTE